MMMWKISFDLNDEFFQLFLYNILLLPSVTFVIKYGATLYPKLANAAYPLVISIIFISLVPKGRDGTSGNFSFIPTLLQSHLSKSLHQPKEYPK